jgi:hypothetical protein
LPKAAGYRTPTLGVRSRGALLNKVPLGATEVKYEVYDRDGKRKLVDYKRATVILRMNGQLHRNIRSKNGYNKVIFVDLRENPLSKSEKKELLLLKPWNYFKAMSDPMTKIRIRATLKGVRPTFEYASQIRESSILSLREGKNIRRLYKPLRNFMFHRDRRTDKDIYDILEYRYVRWALKEIGEANACLYNLGLESEDLENPLLVGSLKLAKGRPSTLRNTYDLYRNPHQGAVDIGFEPTPSGSVLPMSTQTLRE